MIRLDYKEGQPFRTPFYFEPLLRILESYPFPAPTQMSKVLKRGWSTLNILSFTDKKLLKAITPPLKKDVTIATDRNSEAHLGLYISQNKGSDSGITLFNERRFVNNTQLKTLFQELVKCEPFWHIAHCVVFESEIYQKNFTTVAMESKPMLTWLQYFGKLELEKWGGFAAFESNPYLQTERIHDGLLVQLGDDPAIFDTPEGELLLVNAIHALPLIQQ